MFAPSAKTTSAHDLVAASRRLLHAAHHGQDADALFGSLASLDEYVLDALRDDQRAAKAFWLNVHGAFVAWDSNGGRESGRVAGSRVDADRIKHGILRAGRWKHGLGYLPDPFPGLFERTHRLDELDSRVHFATLADRHAPELAVTYTAADVNAELGDVTARYLDRTVEYDADANAARVPRVFLWYRGDFGGGRGVRSFLADHDAIPPDASPRLTYGSAIPQSVGEARRRRPPEGVQ